MSVCIGVSFCHITRLTVVIGKLIYMIIYMYICIYNLGFHCTTLSHYNRYLPLYSSSVKPHCLTKGGTHSAASSSKSSEAQTPAESAHADDWFPSDDDEDLCTEEVDSSDEWLPSDDDEDMCEEELAANPKNQR